MICIKNSILRESLKKHHKEAEHMMIVIPPKQALGFIKPEEYKRALTISRNLDLVTIFTGLAFSSVTKVIISSILQSSTSQSLDIVYVEQ